MVILYLAILLADGSKEVNRRWPPDWTEMTFAGLINFLGPTCCWLHSDLVKDSGKKGLHVTIMWYKE
jgi:hypothetical protein